MIAAAALLGYAVLLLTAGAPVLARAGWPERAPRLAMAAWIALAFSAIVSVVLAGLVMLVPAPRVSRGISWLLATCGMQLRARYAHPGGAALGAVGVLVALILARRLAWCAWATLTATARAGRRHRLRLRLAGRQDDRLGALVVEHAEPAAYCMPGANRPVVLTTAALRLLDDTQLAAVLAHERAHQSGRHHLLVSLAAIPAAAFPRVPAFRHARTRSPGWPSWPPTMSRRRGRRGWPWPRRCSRSAPPRSCRRPRGRSPPAAPRPRLRVRRLIAAPNPLSRAASAAGALAVAALVALPLVLLAAPALRRGRHRPPHAHRRLVRLHGAGPPVATYP